MAMTYRGHVRNGLVVFDERVELLDGTEVQVQPVSQPQSTLVARFKDMIGCVSDLPEERIWRRTMTTISTERPNDNRGIYGDASTEYRG